MMRRLPDDIVDQVMTLVHDGKTTLEIAGLVDCSKETVNRIRREHDTGFRERGGRPIVDRIQVSKMTRQGLTTRQIAELLGCSRRTVERARVAMGVSRPPGRPFTDDELARAEAMLADGAPVVEIERTLGRPQGSLARRFRGRGWSHLEVSRFGGMASRIARADRERKARTGVGPPTTSQPWSST